MDETKMSNYRTTKRKKKKQINHIATYGFFSQGRELDDNTKNTADLVSKVMDVVFLKLPFSAREITSGLLITRKTFPDSSAAKYSTK